MTIFIFILKFLISLGLSALLCGVLFYLHVKFFPEQIGNDRLEWIYSKVVGPVIGLVFLSIMVFF